MAEPTNPNDNPQSGSEIDPATELGAVSHGFGLPVDDPFAADPFAAAGGGDADGLGALLGVDGGIDFGALMEQATNLQSQMMAAQDQLLASEVEGVAGGGAVKISLTGGYEFRAVTIDPSAVDPEDVEMLQDLVLAALNDAASRVEALKDQAVPGGLGLGDLFGVSGAYAGPVQDLIDELGRLPGVGPKSAQRIAFHLLKVSKEDAARLTRSITAAKEKVAWCSRCFNLAEGELCGICRDDRRDATLLCVVEEPKDLVAVEKTGEFKGRYHVLQGAINPIEGVGPDQLRVKELLARLVPEGVQEVILCTNPNIEGEATAMYLGRLLQPLGVAVSRIASGLPVGGDLEYADELTLGRALEGRRSVV